MLMAGHSFAVMAQLHAPGLFASDVAEIASLAVGLHAARTKTPFMTLRARTTAQLTTPIESMLRKAPQMRSTLHYVAASEFPEFHAATARHRLNSRYRSLRRHGLTTQVAETLREALLDRMTPRQAIPEADLLRLAAELIKGRWTSQASPSHMAWQLVRLAWDRADVVMLNASPQWSEELRVFALSDMLRVVDEDQARTYLLKRYIEAYGPVTARDICWWTAFEATYISKTLQLLIKDGWLRTARCPEFNVQLFSCSASRPLAPLVEKSFVEEPIFLAYEDPFLKAYFETRFRYATMAANAAVFYKTGEARASVMWRGRIRGVWEFGGSGKPSTLLLCPRLARREYELLSTRWSEHLRRMGASDLTIQRSVVRRSRTSYE